MSIIFYVARDEPLSTEELQRVTGRPRVSAERGGEGSVVNFVVHWDGDAPVALHAMEAAEVPGHVEGMLGHLLTSAAGDDAHLLGALERLRRTRHVYALDASGAVDDERLEHLVLGLAELLDACFFAEGVIFDAEGEPLLETGLAADTAPAHGGRAGDGGGLDAEREDDYDAARAFEGEDYDAARALEDALATSGFDDEVGYESYDFEDDEDEAEALVYNLYSPRPTPLGADELRRLLDGADVMPVVGGGAEAFRIDWRGVRSVLYPMQRGEVPEHLEGCVEYVVEVSGGEPSAVVPPLFDWIRAVEHVYGLMAEDTGDVERQQVVARMAARLTEHLGGFYFLDGMLFDATGRPLFRPLGVPDDGSLEEGWEPTADQVARFERSKAALERRRVPMYRGRLFVADEEAVRLRSPQEVARRVLVLLAVALHAEGVERDEVEAILHGPQDLTADLSPQERDFLATAEPDPELCQALVWRYEAVWLLLWALGFVDELPWPHAMADMERLMALLDELAADPYFVEQSLLRPRREILDAQDLTLRLHWALRQAYIDRRPIPANLDWGDPDRLVPVTASPAPGVVQERHHALNWLVRLGDHGWDDVPTPT